MKLGIMQPYFFPYIGYFQLIRAVDKFVLYDNIKYTKKGWINRNRFLHNGADADFTIPLKKDSDFLDIRDRRIADVFDRAKVLNRLKEAYRRAPFFPKAFALFEKCIMNPETNLFEFIYFSIREVCAAVGIRTEFIVSSNLDIDRSLKCQDKVLAICRHLGADVYINPIGGQDLYAPDAFGAQGIELKFIRSVPLDYGQFDHAFVPWLSILDVMMFNDSVAIDRMLNLYELC